MVHNRGKDENVGRSNIGVFAPYDQGAAISLISVCVVNKTCGSRTGERGELEPTVSPAPSTSSMPSVSDVPTATVPTAEPISTPGPSSLPTLDACNIGNESFTAVTKDNELTSNSQCPDPDSHFICVGDNQLAGGHELAKDVSTSLDDVIWCTPQAYGADGKVCLESVEKKVLLELTHNTVPQIQSTAQNQSA